MLTGEFGIRVNLVETTGANSTGTYTQSFTAESSISNATIASTDFAVSLAGVIGGNTSVLNLSNVINLASAGTGTDVKVVKNQNVVFSSIKQIVVHNQHTGTNLVYITSASAASTWIPASDRITITPQGAWGQVYNAVTVTGATSSNIFFNASGGSTPIEIFLVGG